MDTLAQHNFNRHVATLKQRLNGMLWHLYDAHNPLENAFCALTIRLLPNRKVHSLSEALPYRTVGMNTVDLLNTMANLGFEYRQFKTTPAATDPRLLPCLFIPHANRLDWPDDPLVILEKDDALKSLTAFACAAESVATLAYQSPQARTMGTAFTFQPIREERQATSRLMRAATGLSWFWAVVSRFYPLLRQILLAGLFLNIIGLAMPLFIILVYDRVIAAHAQATLLYLIPGMLLALGFEWGLRTLRGQSLSWLATRLDAIVTTQIFAHLINLPPPLIEQAPLSSQLARIKTFEYVRDFFSGPIFLSVLELPFTCMAVFLIWYIAGPLVWVPVLASLSYLALFFILRHPIKINLKLAAKASSLRQQFTLETFEKVEAIRTYGLTPAWMEKFRQLSGRECHAHFRLNQCGTVAETLAHALTLAAIVAILAFGTQAVWQGALSVGGLLATMILVWRVLTPFYSLCTMIPRLEQLRNSIRQINQLMDLEVETLKGKARLKKLKGHLSFDTVTFQYTEQEPLLQNLSFNIPAGQTVMLAGPSGAGKTTILKLLHGLYQPSMGTIRVDGVDLRQLDLPDFRRQIAHVPQHPHFFQGSIAENLQLAQPAAHEAELWEALRLADAAEIVAALPHKLGTVIASPQGADISEELAYQLSLARAYLQNAPLLLIDEQPNALLNTNAGALLRQYIGRAAGKRTVVMACARPTFLELAHTVIELNYHRPPHIKAHPHA